MALFALAWVGRKYAAKHDSPRIFWSAVLVGIPTFWVLSKAKIDNTDDVLGHR